MDWHIKAIPMWETWTRKPMGYSLAVLDENERLISHALEDVSIQHDKDWRWPLFSTPEEAMNTYESAYVVEDSKWNKCYPLVKTMSVPIEEEGE